MSRYSKLTVYSGQPPCEKLQKTHHLADLLVISVTFLKGHITVLHFRLRLAEKIFNALKVLVDCLKSFSHKSMNVQVGCLGNVSAKDGDELAVREIVLHFGETPDGADTRWILVCTNGFIFLFKNMVMVNSLFVFFLI